MTNQSAPWWQRVLRVSAPSRLWLLPVGIGVMFGYLGAMDAAWDYSKTDGWPVERAVVTSVESDRSGSCGKVGGRVVIGWRVLDPSRTRGDAFVGTASCDLVSVDEVHEIVRVPTDDEWDVYVDPSRSKTDVGREVAIHAALGFLGTWLVLGAPVIFRAVVGRLWPSRRGRHRAGPGVG